MRPVKMLCAAVALFGLAACNNDLKVTGVEPATGVVGGGEDVVIEGGGFQPGRGGVTVKFGKRDATAVVVASADRIKVTTPPGDANSTVDITVIFDDGKAFKLGNSFKYIDRGLDRATGNNAFNQLSGQKK